MKLKTMASTFLLSTFLVGGMATEVEAVTLDPQEYIFEETTTYYDGTEITIQMTLDGYLGAIDAEPYLGSDPYYLKNGTQFLVVEAGSSFQVSIFCEDESKTYCDLFGMENPPDWDNDYIFEASTGICGSWYNFQSENSAIVDVFGFPLWAQFYLDDLDTMVVTNSGFEYELVEVERSVYACNDIPLGAFEYGILNGQWTYNAESDYHYWANPFAVYFANILAIDQEGVDQLVETGTSLFQEDYPTIGRTPIYYPGLLELFGGTTPIPQPSFSSWAEPQVTFAMENNLIVDSLGYDYTKSITRTQIATLLVNMIEQYTGTDMPQARVDTFFDSSEEAVLKAYEAGIISGTDEKRFSPIATATRQEIAIMIVNAIKVLEENTGESFVDHSLTSLEGFSDFETTADWAQNHVAILANNGIMTGSDGNLTPLSETSIQECLVLNNNLFKLGE